jgi:hypothetical protein
MSAWVRAAILLLIVATSASFAGCGEPGIEGAWAECDSETCLEIDDDGVIFREDGTALQIMVEEEKIAPQATFCSRRGGGAVRWELDDGVLTIVDGNEISSGTAEIEENRLIIRERTDARPILFQRLADENDLGVCI